MALAETQPPERETPPLQVFSLLPGRVSLGTPLMLGALVGLFAVNALIGAFGPQGRTLAVLSGGFLGVLVAFASTALARRRVPDRLLLEPDSVTLARGDRRIRSVKPARLTEVNELPSPSGPLLLLSDHRDSLVVFAAQLERPRDYETISQAIVDMVRRADPSGELGREAVEAGRTRVHVARQPSRGTLVLSVVLGLGTFWAFEALKYLSGNPFPEEEIGAMSVPLLWAGESFRLFSYAFIHSSLMHLALNTLALVWLGSYLEKLIGWERMLLAFAAGVAGGAVGHVLVGGPVPLVGSSGGVFGLIGLLAALATVGRKGVPRWLLPRPGFWIVNGLLSVLLPFLFPEISWAAHLGGAVAGWIVGALSIVGVRLPEDAADRRHMRGFGILAAVALAVGVVGGVLHPRQEHPFDTEVLIQAYLALPESDEALVLQNDVAYRMAANPEVSSDALTVASRLAESAVEMSRRSLPHVLDTLAVVRYRQGEVEEAVMLMEEALSLLGTDDPGFRAFLKRRLAAMRAGARVLPEN